MKILPKLAIISICIYANAMEVDVNKNYIKELLNYKVTLPKEIYNPFVIQNSDKLKQKLKKVQKKINTPSFIEKKLDLLAILNNKVLVKLEGDNTDKWLEVGDKIDEYTITKIINSNSILVTFRKKAKIITMKRNKFNIRVEQ